jgi:hypothetical protein
LAEPPTWTASRSVMPSPIMTTLLKGEAPRILRIASGLPWWTEGGGAVGGQKVVSRWSVGGEEVVSRWSEGGQSMVGSC